MRSNKESISEAILMIELVDGKSLMEYNGEENRIFAKITVALHRFIPAAKRVLETTQVYSELGHHVFSAFESNVDIEMR